MLLLQARGKRHGKQEAIRRFFQGLLFILSRKWPPSCSKKPEPDTQQRTDPNLVPWTTGHTTPTSRLCFSEHSLRIHSTKHCPQPPGHQLGDPLLRCLSLPTPWKWICSLKQEVGVKDSKTLHCIKHHSAPFHSTALKSGTTKTWQLILLRGRTDLSTKSLKEPPSPLVHSWATAAQAVGPQKLWVWR